jgi:hypothetical protein
LWSGTAASWVDLNAAGATKSAAVGVHDGRQVGYARFDGVDRASLWSGAAASWVDLHPAGATVSTAYAIHDGQQVGYVRVDGPAHASLWSGTPESWVDLNPPGAQSSHVHDVYAGRQVGGATILGVSRASFWSGTAQSWEDLSAALSGSWLSSGALGVWSDETTIYVVGHGYNLVGGRNEALMWTRPLVVGCYVGCDGSGELDVFDFLCFQNLFASGDPVADCDESGVVDYFDFLCFQNAFAARCL